MAAAAPPETGVVNRKEAAKRDHTHNYYAKWDKLDYKALGLDSDDEDDKKRPRESPQEARKAFDDHRAERAAAEKRLAELKKEQAAAEERLKELDRQRAFMDKATMFFGVAMVLLMGLASFWVYSQER